MILEQNKTYKTHKDTGEIVEMTVTDITESVFTAKTTVHYNWTCGAAEGSHQLSENKFLEIIVEKEETKIENTWAYNIFLGSDFADLFLPVSVKLDEETDDYTLTDKDGFSLTVTSDGDVTI
jgi:hypothetical protein